MADDDITGRDSYLIMQALAIARKQVMREGRVADAQDMTRLLENRYPQWRNLFPPDPPEPVE